MGEFIELTTEDNHTLKAYKVMPPGTPRGAVVVVQEIFGVNSHIRSVADRIAALGYVAIAPAMFDRYERDVDIGYQGEDRQHAFALAGKLDAEAALKDIAAAKSAVAEYGKAGIVGFCFGGSMAWLSACRLGFDAAIGYYGGFIARFATETPTCPVILHFGENDDHIPLSVGETVKANHPDVMVYTYAGGHAFNRDADPDVYVKASAELAWDRTAALLARAIG